MPPRNRPPDHLPPAVRDHPAVTAACQQRDLGKLFRTINNLTEEPERFTATHIGILCQMPTTRIQDYMRGKHTAPTLDTVTRVADGLHIPGHRFGLTPRPWETAASFQPPPDLPIGQNIRRLREARNKTQEVIAGLAGIEPHHYGRIERGTRTPSITALHNIARALDTPTAQLLDRQPQPPHDNTTPPPSTADAAPNKQLRAARIAAGMSQDDLARYLRDTCHLHGSNKRQVQRWESGHNTWPHRPYREALSILFERSPTELGFIPAATRHTPDQSEPGIGELIRELRHERGLSQGDLADALNEAIGETTVTRNDISRYESETRMPTTDRIIEALATALDTPEPELRAATRRSWAERQHHLYGDQPRAWQRQDPAHQPNDLIRQHRHARGWTQQEAAEAIAAVVQRPNGIDAQYIARLERGQIRWPNADYRAAIRTVYGAATDAELGLTGMRTRTDSPHEPHDTANSSAGDLRPLPALSDMLHAGSEEADDMHRRELLRTTLTATGLGITAPAMAALEQVRRAMDTTLESTKIGPSTLDRWSQIADDYAAVYQITPAQEMLPDIITDFAQIQRLIADSQPVRTRVTLCHATARLAILAAVCLSALGNHREARAWLHTARLAAEETGDLALTGQALARTSIVSLYYGAPTTALAEATQAMALLGSHPTPATARARIVQARAHARLGHNDEALIALDQAADLHSALPASETADTAFGYTDRQFTWHYANALTHLGRTREAADLQVRALSAYHPGERLDPVLIRLDIASGIMRDGDPDSAVATAVDTWTSLPVEHRTGMVVRYTHDLLASVPDRAAELPTVRALRELTAASGPDSTTA
jgi:transcriptional regulator with XRE-family HTH domain